MHLSEIFEVSRASIILAHKLFINLQEILCTWHIHRLKCALSFSRTDILQEIWYINQQALLDKVRSLSQA